MIRFYNGKVLKFENGARITDEEVWTDGALISYVGAKKAEMPEFEREIDLNGDLIIPGFKNAHTHSAMTFIRSMADNMPLDRWLSEQVWPNEMKLTDEIVYVMSKLAIMEYLTSGITACYDMYSHNEATIRATVDTGFRTVISCDMNNFDRDYTVVEERFRKFNSLSDRVSYRLGIHAEYTTCLERMEYIVDLIRKYKAPAFTHLCETEKEVQDCIDRYGKTPPKMLSDLGFFDYGGGGYHCVHMSDEDIEIFKEKGLWVVLNSASNLKLASGIAPVRRYIDEGINLALGTDGAASNNALDMFREMYLSSVLAKYRENDASAVDADKVLEAACVGGARAMGLYDCDAVAEGKKADLCVINLRRPNMHPFNNISKNLVYSGSKENVRMTVVNGEILYENGKFYIGEDAEGIYAAAEEMMKTFRK